jgi:hypothetical protein
MTDEREKETAARDERIAIPLDPEVALKALLRVDPEPTEAPEPDKAANRKRVGS